MKLGRESAYAIDGLVELAASPVGTVILLGAIAARRRIPQSFLAKIFQKLARSGIVSSSRGAVRGYALARRPKEITVKEILLAVEGPELFNRCIFWSERCAEADPCPMHFKWKWIKERIIGELMEGTTLADLARRELSQRPTGKRA